MSPDNDVGSQPDFDTRLRVPIHPSSAKSPPTLAGGNGKPSPKCGISVGWGNNNNNEGDLSGDDDEVEVVLPSSEDLLICL